MVVEGSVQPHRGRLISCEFEPAKSAGIQGVVHQVRSERATLVSCWNYVAHYGTPVHEMG